MQDLDVAIQQSSAGPAASISCSLRAVEFPGFSPLAPRMRALLLAHITCSVLLASRDATYFFGVALPSLFVLTCLSIAQLVLLGFWAGMGSRNISQSARIALGGTVFLSVVWASQLVLQVGPWEALIALCVLLLPVSVALSVLTFFFVAICTWVGELQGAQPGDPSRPAPRWRWSIKQLFVAVLVASVLLALARLARLHSRHPDSVFALFALSSTSIGLGTLAAIWAPLADGVVLWRSIFALALSLFLAALLAVGWNSSETDVVRISVAGLLSAAIVVASLLVVRSCGYRLVRKTIRSPTNKRSADLATPEKQSVSPTSATS